MPGMLANFTMANSKGLYPKLGGRSTRKRRKPAKRSKGARSGNGSRKRIPNPPARRLVKGSAAAKAYMAKIRRKRRR